MDEIRAAMRRLRKSLGPGHPRAQTHQAYSGYLAGLIAYHSHLYYNEANPELTDVEFDEIWDEMSTRFSKNPQLQKVGSDPPPGSVKVEHLFPMLSLDKSNTEEEVAHFVTAVSYTHLTLPTILLV